MPIWKALHVLSMVTMVTIFIGAEIFYAAAILRRDIRALAFIQETLERWYLGVLALLGMIAGIVFGLLAAASGGFDFVAGWLVVAYVLVAAFFVNSGLIGAKIFDLDAVIVAPDEFKREVQTLRAPIPVLGATGRVYAWRFSFEGEFSALSIGDRGTLYEYEMGTRFHISDRIAAQGGYRALKIDAKDGADQGALRIGGWQFGLELSL